MTENQNGIKPETPEKKQSVISSAFDYLEIFVFAACAVLLLFTFSIRLCRVDGQSMCHTLEDTQMLLVSDVFYTPTQGDIIVFHQTNNEHGYLNKPLVKRVIATGGQFIRIEYYYAENETDEKYVSMKVYVSEDENFEDSELLDEDYLDLYTSYTESNREITINSYVNTPVTYEVPEGMLFVMGDNRYNSNDSRYDVGFVDEDCVLGRLMLRVAPFGTVN